MKVKKLLSIAMAAALVMGIMNPVLQVRAEQNVEKNGNRKDYEALIEKMKSDTDIEILGKKLTDWKREDFISYLERESTSIGSYPSLTIYTGDPVGGSITDQAGINLSESVSYKFNDGSSFDLSHSEYASVDTVNNWCFSFINSAGPGNKELSAQVKDTIKTGIPFLGQSIDDLLRMINDDEITREFSQLKPDSDTKNFILRLDDGSYFSMSPRTYFSEYPDSKWGPRFIYNMDDSSEDYITYEFSDDGYITGISYSVKTNHEEVPEEVIMYRLYNQNSGEHFYTSNEEEMSNLIRAGWKGEGMAWKAPSYSNTPVYRVYNPNSGEHHYTTDIKERDHLLSLGWRDENIGWYSDDQERKPMYRVYNPNATGVYAAGAHHYTRDSGEAGALIQNGWVDEGIGWYGI